MSDNQIERIEAPTREFFQTNYMNRNKPVILTGVSTTWRATSGWSPDYLKSVAGQSNITVHFHKDRNFHSWYLRPWEREDRKLTLSEWLDILITGNDYKQYYMTEHRLRDVSATLVEDVDMSTYVDKQDPFLFMGRDTYMPLHYHGTTEALLCQLQGTKNISLYPPSQFSLIYYRPWYSYSWLFSQVDTRKPDYQKFPKFKRTEPLTFTLAPGEILFIPVHWGHVTSVPVYQVSVTFFWSARTQNFHFPTPGMHVYLRKFLHFSKRFRNAQ